jgi:hypothetical protein
MIGADGLINEQAALSTSTPAASIASNGYWRPRADDDDVTVPVRPDRVSESTAGTPLRR